MKHDPWNRCDVCGKFIPLNDFAFDKASHTLVNPDSDRSREEWETLCKDHSGLKARLEA